MTRRTLSSSRCSVSTEWSDGCELGSSTAMNASPSSSRSESNRVADQPVTREAQPEHLATVRRPLGHRRASSGDRLRSADRAAPTANGSDGWRQHRRDHRCRRPSSRARSRREKHIPTAPTPGPPTSACRLRASARSQAMIGDVCCSAQCRELASDAQPGATIGAMYGPLGSLPGVPTSDGITTVNPASTTSLANAGDHRGDARGSRARPPRRDPCPVRNVAG